MAAFSSVELRPSNHVQSRLLGAGHDTVKFATGAVLPGGCVTVTWRSAGGVVAWSWLSIPRMRTV